VPEIDWAVVQEIHAIKRAGGRIDNATISVTKDTITIRREYNMPDGQRRIMKNSYREGEVELSADLLMLEVESG
jgi:hypothetical protein